MDGVPARKSAHRHGYAWRTVLALCLVTIGLLGCLCALIGFPTEAQVTGGTVSSPGSPIASYRSGAISPEVEAELTAVRNQLHLSQNDLRQSARQQRQILTAWSLLLAVLFVAAVLIVLRIYLQARARDGEASRANAEVEAMTAELKQLRHVREQARSTLPALLNEVGEHPLTFQEEGTAFAPRSAALMDDIDQLAYLGLGRFVFGDSSTPPEAAVYLNGLLLSAVSHLERRDPWAAFARLDHFFSHLSRFQDAVDRRRIAQAYSYRAQAGYQLLEARYREPSWLRKAERAQLESLSKQAFADIAQAASVDPEWKHTTFVEALLCSHFYLAEEPAEGRTKNDLMIRGLRRAVSLYKGLIEEKAYRGPGRRNLVRCFKQIAELTGEKSDFSDFGYALNAFPTDEELADEALAARQPSSRDRFLWQWLLGDEDLFANVQRLNQAEYRAFWIRMLDTKVRLRNWRADLEELREAKPQMKEWMIQLLQSEPIPLSQVPSRRSDRFESPATGV